MHLEYWFEMANKWTFAMPKLRNFILRYIPDNALVLIPFAGKYRFPKMLNKTKFIYNDLSEDIKCDYHYDAKELRNVFDKEYFDCIVADPPYSLFQFYAKYTKAKKEGTEKNFKADYIVWRETAEYLLKPNGIYIELGYNSTGIDMKKAEKIALGICCLGSTHNDILILVQRKKKKNEINKYFQRQ